MEDFASYFVTRDYIKQNIIFIEMAQLDFILFLHGLSKQSIGKYYLVKLRNFSFFGRLRSQSKQVHNAPLRWGNMDLKIGCRNHSPQSTKSNMITILKYFYIVKRCIANITSDCVGFVHRHIKERTRNSSYTDFEVGCKITE